MKQKNIKLKTSNLFALLITCSIFLFYSCQKDGNINETNESVEVNTDFEELILSLRSDDICLEVPELCPTIGEIAKPGGPGTSGGGSFGILFKDGDSERLVVAIESTENSKSFAVISQEEIVVMSDNPEAIYTKFADESIEIPDCIKQVFNMEFNKWTDGSLSLGDVQQTYSDKPVTRDLEQGIVVVEGNFNSDIDPDCPPPSKAVNSYYWCNYRISATTSAIQKHLMKGMSSDVINSTKFTVRQAVKNCAPPAPDCYGCIDQKCILDALKESLGSAFTKRLREKYLQLYLRMTDEQFAVLKGNQDLFNEYLNFYGLKSPVECDGDCQHAVSGAKARLETSTGEELSQAEIDKLCDLYTSDDITFSTYNCLKESGNLLLDQFMLYGPATDVEDMLSIQGCSDAAKDARRAKALFWKLNQTLELDDNKTYLEANLIHLERIEEFLSKHFQPGNGDDCDGNNESISKAVANAYADICDEVEELDMGDVGDSSDVIWKFMKEAVLESVKEIVADFIPGGTLALMGPELLSNLQSGMWMDAMFTAVEIVVNEADVCFPIAKVASAGIGLAVTGKQLKKAFQAFNKVKSLGEGFITNLYNVFRTKLNWSVKNVRDRFEWLGGVNNLIKGIGGEEFFDKFKEQFDVTFVFLNNQHPVFKVIEIPVDRALYAELYPDANSGWGFTLEITKGPKNATGPSQLTSVYKFRFFA